MITKTYNIKHNVESNICATIVQTSSKYKSDINFSIENRHTNAKSLMGLISLNILEGEKLIVVCSGEDEVMAAREMDSIFSK